MSSPPTPFSGMLLHALRLLSGRPHSSAELTTKLAALCKRRKQSKISSVRGIYGDAQVDCSVVTAAVIKDLSERKLLDDPEFARWHVENRVRYRPRSKIELAFELKGKGIAAASVNRVISEEHFDEEAACAAITFRQRRSKNDEKMTNYLARRGFPFRMIKATLQKKNAEETALKSDEHSLLK